MYRHYYCAPLSADAFNSTRGLVSHWNTYVIFINVTGIYVYELMRTHIEFKVLFFFINKCHASVAMREALETFFFSILTCLNEHCRFSKNFRTSPGQIFLNLYLDICHSEINQLHLEGCVKKKKRLRKVSQVMMNNVEILQGLLRGFNSESLARPFFTLIQV